MNAVDIEKFLLTIDQAVAHYRVPVVDLIGVQTADPFRVLVATILSSRTRDEVTAVAAGRLFEEAATAKRLSAMDVESIRELIYPVGFYKTKALHLKQTGTILIERYQGQVPCTIEELVTLPGVGRKTANLVLSVAYDIPAICVDTHVHRIMNIWGYVTTDTPLKTEMALRKKLPVKYWKMVNRVLVAFGQGMCKPVAPHCDVCMVQKDCAQRGVTPRKIT